MLSNRFDPPTRRIADRHYNRQKVGSPQFVPPGRCLVLATEKVDAFWVTSWPFAEWVKHEWAGAWVCSAFRNEGPMLSSDLIQEAVAATVWRWPEIPEQGFVTFVDRAKTRPKKHAGYCYRMAGWDEIGKTKGGLIALGLAADEMPEPIAPLGSQMELAA
jgi:hypothetical protein